MASQRGSTRVPRSPRDAETRSRSAEWALGLSVLALLFVLPVLVGLGAACISEDASILGYVDRHGPLADWSGAQYGLRLVRFWRPLVTDSWWLGEQLFGVAPAGLRLVNVAAELVALLACLALVRGAGASRRAALLAAALLATFPALGGTLVWLAGRTDLLCAALMLVALACAQRGALVCAAASAFAACATKEFAFLLPIWGGCVLWAGRAEQRALVRGVLVLALAAGVAFVLRRLALGTAAGGYLLATRDLAALVADGPRALVFAATGVAPLLVLLAVLGLLGYAAGSLAPRLFVAGLVACGTALVLVMPLTRAARLEPQNERLLFVAEVGLALALAAVFARPAARGLAYGSALALALLALGARSGLALADALEWKEAAAVGEQAIERARLAVRSARPSDRPVLAADFPRAWRGAYCLLWGVADRFRAPFEPTPRPVWPDRAMFSASAERPRAHAARPDGTRWPFDDPPSVPALALRDAAGATLARLEVDERSFQAELDRSPRLVFDPPAQELGLEAAVYTELGSHAVPLGEVRAGEASLMRLLGASDGAFALGDALRQAGDVGATHAFLELRLVGPQGELRAASPWVELVWDSDLED